MKLSAKKIFISLGLILNLLISLIVAFLLGAAGAFQCFDQENSCNPNAGPYLYAILALVWGIGSSIYFYNHHLKN